MQKGQEFTISNSTTNIDLSGQPQFKGHESTISNPITNIHQPQLKEENQTLH